MNTALTQIVIFGLLAAVVLRIPGRWPGREARVFALNAGFIAVSLSGFGEVAPVAAFVILSYGALLVVRHAGFTWTLASLVTAVVALYAWLRQYTLLKVVSPHLAAPHAFVIVGLSYILFRVVHLLVDCRDGAARLPSFPRYLNYCYFFPSFISGPIQRFQDFEAQMDRPLPPLTVPVLHAALGRILLGIVMTLGVSLPAARAGTWAQEALYGEGGLARGTLWASVAVLSYLVNLFANFAGYMHIVVGIGKICGFDLPENFNKPYLAQNYLDLWSRWHITLSEWFRFYLFNPFLKLLVGKWGGRSAGPYLGAVAFFLTFLVMGIWHGTTLLFVAYGLFLGLGAMGNKAWQVFLSKRLGKARYRDLVRRPWYVQVSRGLTLSYFAVSLTCLWVAPARLAGRAPGRLVGEFGGGLLALAVAFALAGIVAAGFARLVAPRPAAPPAAPRGSGAMIAAMAAKVVAVAYLVLLARNSVPEFIYKDF
jgi:D-alanyl-lipoteichoic acid acyltransferase DltB (MBOAT superfamily)